jgi:pimeloyl-ACP methyl ester carboxylesterase
MPAVRWSLLGALSLALAVSATAQDAKKAASPSLKGEWVGSLKVSPDIALKIVVEVDEEGAATFASPDQGPTKFAVDALKVEGDAVSFKVPQIGGTFEGKRDAKGAELAGTWKQGPANLPLVLRPSKGEKMAEAIVPPALEGLWAGSLKVNAGIELRIVVRVEKDPKTKALVAKMDSPDQGVSGIPITAVALDKNRLMFKVSSIGGSYEGTLDPKTNEVKGTWTQLGNKMPLDLKKTDKLEEVRRPQHPKPPFPYETESIAFESASAKATLAGTLSRPKGDGPFAAVVMITGSGQQDRDETLLGHKPFLVIADALTRAGVAVLRLDDRGAGESKGSAAEATTENFAGDIGDAVAFLKTRKEIDPKRIGLIGHSEGGLIGPMVAVAHPDDVAFLVLLAGPGVPGDEIVSLQTSLIAKASGAKEGSLKELMEGQAKVLELAKTADTKEKREALRPLARAMSALDVGETGKTEEATPDAKKVDAMIAQLTAPWMRFFLSHDPRPVLKRVRCPVLALNGEKDLQVDPTQNLPEIEKALKEAGNTDVTLVKLPGLNHLFQPCKTGSPAEYSRIETTFDPAALDLMVQWVVDKSKTAAKP